MRSTPRYTLWFVNRSLRAGQVCVYHDPDNVACSQGTPQQLAWRVAAANPQVQVGFEWEAAWQLQWCEDGAQARARQYSSADLPQGNAVLLSRNAYGCEFTPLPELAARNQLLVQSDTSIQADSAVRVGLAMDGAGAFAVPAGPNLTCAFTPVRERALAYWISFGAYGLGAGDALDSALLNLPLRVSFPERVTSMTAVLDEQNSWSLLAGPPANDSWSRSRAP